MPYDTLLWGEEQAASGLTDTAALANQNHKKDADKLTLLSEPTPPWLQGLGSVSDTKPQGCALKPDTLDAGLPIYGPGAISFWHEGWFKELREAPIKLLRGDKITGQGSNTNVNEGMIIAADIAYGNAIPPWLLKTYQASLKKIFTDIIAITTAAAVTFNSGAVSMDQMTNYSKWADPEAEFVILGVISHIGAATFGGILNVTKLGGPWQGKQPGIPVPPLSAVTFSPGGSFVKALEPIPFKGDSLCEVGMTTPSAGAMNLGLLMGKK